MPALGLLLVAGAVARAQLPRPLRPGDILVNQDHLVLGETGEHGTFLIDPVTLEKTRFYGSYEAPNAVAVDRDGTILSADGFFREVVRLDGRGHVLREYRDVPGASDMAVAPDGTIYLTRSQSIYRLDPAAGEVRRVAQVTQAVGDFSGVAVASDGTLYATLGAGLPDSPRGVFRVNPAGGALTPVSTGGLLTTATSLAIDASGRLVVADALTDSLVAVDPATGAQQLLASGGLLDRPLDLAFEPGGTLLVIGTAPGGTGSALLRVDPLTGTTTLLTGLVSPVDLAVVPIPEPAHLSLLAVVSLVLLRRRGYLR